MPKKQPNSPQYQVLTYDPEYMRWTPQKGVRSGPYSLMGLRTALRKLQDMGYDTSRNGSFSVLVERLYTDEERAAQLAKAQDDLKIWDDQGIGS